MTEEDTYSHTDFHIFVRPPGVIVIHQRLRLSEQPDLFAAIAITVDSVISTDGRSLLEAERRCLAGLREQYWRRFGSTLRRVRFEDGDNTDILPV